MNKMLFLILSVGVLFLIIPAISYFAKLNFSMSLVVGLLLLILVALAYIIFSKKGE